MNQGALISLNTLQVISVAKSSPSIAENLSVPIAGTCGRWPCLDAPCRNAAEPAGMLRLPRMGLQLLRLPGRPAAHASGDHPRPLRFPRTRNSAFASFLRLLMLKHKHFRNVRLKKVKHL